MPEGGVEAGRLGHSPTLSQGGSLGQQVHPLSDSDDASSVTESSMIEHGGVVGDQEDPSGSISQALP
eukprot:scaffold224358_cov33-Prasinocladus_malaysianus.AAC.1